MLELIKRTAPEIADCFVVELCEKTQGKSFYNVYTEDDMIHISGDCPVSIAMGFYDYLKQYCGVELSHCGNRTTEIDVAPFPYEPLVKIIEQEKRAYFNYCTFGYSMRSWQWEEWEREIDFMAMMGVNMPLTVVGYEAVMFYTLLDFGFTQEQALSFIAGPSYYPWQMMTNLDSFMPIPHKEFIDKRLELGQRIIKRELELGMTPIQQGFAGHIPGLLKEKLRLSRELQHLPTWCGFPGTVQLDPLDDAFSVFGRALLEKQKELFGAYHYYACDPFHENEPPCEGEDYLNDVGRAISAMYRDFDDKAVWVMQAWSLREEIVKAVPKSRLLILDLDGSKCELTQGFWGYSFICGTLHNFGDRNSLHGSISLLARNQYASAKEQYPDCVGTGLFMEGFFQNPLYYDLAFTMLTQSKQTDLEQWLSDYARRRYGSDEQCLYEAVRLLAKSCYSDACTGRETGSVICARPSTTYYHTAPNDHVELRYNNEELLGALRLLMKSRDAYKDGYYFDLCDILRQYLSNYAKQIYFDIMKQHRKGSREHFEQAVELFLRVLSLTDRLLATRRELTLDEHVMQAMDNACCEEHEDIFIRNEVALLTIWGPFENNELFDYAWKEWSGLIKHYYMPRWELFFEELRSCFGEDISHISDTPFNHNERNDYETTEFQKKLRDFEFDFVRSYTLSDPPSQEKTEDVVKEILFELKK